MKRPAPLSSLPAEQIESLVSVLDAVRNGAATTRPEVAHRTGLGRNVVTQRVSQLVDLGVLRTTLGEHFGTINAANLRRAHALLESGKAKGKIVLEGF